eukprot:jgi/Hompol1/6183/HPOL_002222-RA
MHIIDSYGEPETYIGFTSSPADRGAEEGAVFGWEHGQHHEFVDVQAIEHRKLLFEIMSEGRDILGCTDLDVFKPRAKEQFDINDGVHKLILRSMTNGKLGVAIPGDNYVVVRIYSPKQGVPPAKRFKPALVAPPIPQDAWIAVPYQSLEMPYTSKQTFTLAIDGALTQS